MEIMACNTVNNFNDWVNPGVGVSLSLFKSLQLYTLFDYVSSMYLVDGKSFRFFFGLNLVLGHERKNIKTEVPKVPTSIELEMPAPEVDRQAETTEGKTE